MNIEQARERFRDLAKGPSAERVRQAFARLRELGITADEAAKNFERACATFAGEPLGKREPLGLVDTTATCLSKMTMEDDDAREALLNLLGAAHRGEFLALLLDLDDMNMRGRQIAVAYRFAGEDGAIFRHMIFTRDPRMVAYVNELLPRYPAAVERGGSPHGLQVDRR